MKAPPTFVTYQVGRTEIMLDAAKRIVLRCHRKGEVEQFASVILTPRQAIACASELVRIAGTVTALYPDCDR